ncbi:kinetochore-associated Ndc80 complex subunit spc25 [Microbotryomycetes sp. JL201]|nr:kinetochore-associated Ndc80 complex subunit spc25 [Microbotryomycetes sp. JL201]
MSTIMMSPATTTTMTMSTTPRSGRRLTTNMTPSRLTGNNASTSVAPAVIAMPTLPQLNLRPYRQSPYAVDSQFKLRLQDDWAAVDYAVQTMEQALSAKRKDINASLAELDEEKRRIEHATKALGEAAKEMQLTLKKELDEQREAKDKKQEVEQRQRHLEQQVAALALEIKEEQKKLAARREVKARQREAFQRQANKNGPELAFFEQKLGLQIKGVARDVVQFRFQNIDSRNYQRSFAFNVDASQPAYRVEIVAPGSAKAPYLASTVVQPLVEVLNHTRDLYAFTREMRHAFKDEVALEKMGFAPGDQGETADKVKERARKRQERTTSDK